MDKESAVSAPGLTPQDPWPGLASFQEEGAAHFFGRSREIQELTEMIEIEDVVLVAAASGIGKTSLLQAGVFPRLRLVEFLPVPIRLNHSAGAAPYDRQIDLALARVHAEGQIDDPAPERPVDQSLWEYLHDREFALWDQDNRLLTPVFVFDQFEELFTRAQEEGREKQATLFLHEVADLAEHRPPPTLKQHSGISVHTPPSYKIVLSIRKDFLAELEHELGSRMPSMLHNRFFLLPLNGQGALEAVAKPADAEHLLAAEADEAIVRFAARKGHSSRDADSPRPPLEKLVVEPAILSLICRQLNRKRRALGQRQITASLLDDSQSDIIREFVDDCLAEFSPGVETFLESLVTASGVRGSVAWDAALEENPGLTTQDLRKLVDDRVIRRESSAGGVTTVELVHDLLAREIHQRRSDRLAALEEKQKRQEERARLEDEARAAQEILKKEATEAKLRADQARERAQVIISLLIAGICAPLAAVASWQKLDADAAHRETNEILSAYGSSIQLGRSEGNYAVVRAAIEGQLARHGNRGNPDLLEILADSQMNLGDWEGLDQTLATLKRVDPEGGARKPNAQRRYLRARLAEGKGQTEEAVKAWEEYLSTGGLTDLQRQNAYRALTALYKQSGEPDKAMGMVEMGLQLAEVPLLLERAHLLVDRREWDAALGAFGVAEDAGANSAVLEESRSQFDRIRQNLEHLKHPGPGFIGKAQALRDAGLTDLAIEDYREAWERGEDNAALRADLEELVLVASQSPEAWHLLGLTQFADGDYQKAVDSFRRSLEKRPSPEVERDLASVEEELR